jgi:type VI secretion system protein
MTESIFDVLTGRFAEEKPVSTVPKERRLLWSVVSNLNRLFNTRRGSVAHLPDYGLPDLLSGHRDAPDSASELRRAIRESIETYEPRLRHVRIRRRTTDTYAMRLVFLVQAELITGEDVRFETTFESQQSATVEPIGSGV